MDQFGYSVASAGDVNDDGFDDVIIGLLGAQIPSGRRATIIAFDATPLEGGRLGWGLVPQPTYKACQYLRPPSLITRPMPVGALQQGQ